MAPAQHTSDAMANVFSAPGLNGTTYGPSTSTLRRTIFRIASARGDERQLQVEDGIGQRLRGVGNEQDNAGGDVQPESQPHHRQETTELHHGNLPRDAEHAQIQRRVDAGDQPEANRVDRQDDRERKIDGDSRTQTLNALNSSHTRKVSAKLTSEIIDDL